jgi:hypothetical protein
MRSAGGDKAKASSIEVIMRLYSGQFNLIANDIIKALLEAELLELDNGKRQEAELDIVGVLREYVRTDREISAKARDLTINDGKQAEMQMKRRLAKEKGFKLGDEGIDYLVSQILETFMQSDHVEEIFGSDRDLRARINPIIKRYTASRDDEVDKEVRSKIKNLEEGSSAWNIEYERAMERVQKNKGLT